MSNLFFRTISLLIITCLCSCSEKPPAPPKVDGNLALEFASAVYGIGPKASGSEGAHKAANYIKNTISGIGFSAEIDEWRQVDGEGVETTYRNISATVPGKKKDFIIVGSHYDSKKIATVPSFAGANDGASSTGLLLAALKALKTSGSKPPCTLKFVFLDGEECLVKYSAGDGLAGSKRLATQLRHTGSFSSCRAVVIMDMIGDRDLNISIPSNSSQELTDALIGIAGKSDLKGLVSRSPAAITDDHVPFLELGIPAIDVIDFNYGENNRYWHTEGDTIDKLSPGSLEASGTLMMELIFQIK